MYTSARARDNDNFSQCDLLRDLGLEDTIAEREVPLLLSHAEEQSPSSVAEAVEDPQEETADHHVAEASEVI